MPVVAVTGATGFLGRHIVTALKAAGLAPRLLIRRDAPEFSGVDTVRGGLEDADALAALVAGAAAVVHAAGLIKGGPAEFLRVNRDGTGALARAARHGAGHARFILISSLAARAPGISPYAASKAAGEAAVRAVYADLPDRLFILRPAAIYGPHDRETLAIFKAARLGIAPVCGPGRVAFIHAADAAGAIVRLATGAGMAGSYALADGNPAGYAMAGLVAEAARALDRPAPREIPVPPAMLLGAAAAAGMWGALRRRPGIFTPGKAREMLHPDWSIHPGEALPDAIHRPRITLPQGFRETAAWYRAAGWLPR